MTENYPCAAARISVHRNQSIGRPNRLRRERSRCAAKARNDKTNDAAHFAVIDAAKSKATAAQSLVFIEVGL